VLFQEEDPTSDKVREEEAETSKILDLLRKEREARELREKKGDANIKAVISHWSEERARLDVEIQRKIESSRFSHSSKLRPRPASAPPSNQGFTSLSADTETPHKNQDVMWADEVLQQQSKDNNNDKDKDKDKDNDKNKEEAQDIPPLTTDLSASSNNPPSTADSNNTSRDHEKDEALQLESPYQDLPAPSELQGDFIIPRDVTSSGLFDVSMARMERSMSHKDNLHRIGVREQEIVECDKIKGLLKSMDVSCPGFLERALISPVPRPLEECRKSLRPPPPPRESTPKLKPAARGALKARPKTAPSKVR